MAGVTFDDRWQYNGCRVLRLENELLRVDVLPELGGKILHLVHKPTDRDYLWHHPALPPTLLPNGSNYDDNFCGGWDDCFPNVAAGQHAGEFYPDHGEYWTRRFDWDKQSTADAITLYLRAEGHITPTRIEKWITLEASSAALKIRGRITHLGEHAFDYLWAQHPALAVRPGHNFVIPASKGIVASPGMGRLAAAQSEFEWPLAPGRSGQVDLSQVPTSAGVCGYEMVYLTELKAGWYAVVDRRQRCGFALAFDRSVFNTLWLFQSYGGWRGLHVAILEPCTGWPYDLAQAAAHGHCGRLQPGEVLETQTAAVIFTGRDDVSNVDTDGRIT
ncbi:MAG TPA: DUF5107 domain-containing protein [Phycisphaerae bacterium]|nr:DUF5107 domain-containing protein [Phycisphaerae bacterium]HOQ84727.1 DUF5107 domain-containing protein [Phycisphaerae bacterium]